MTSLPRPSGHRGDEAPWWIRSQTYSPSLPLAAGSPSQMAWISSEFSLTCVEIKFYGAFVLNLRVVLHAIFMISARWRGDAGSSLLDGARTAASSPSASAPDALVDFHTVPHHGVAAPCGTGRALRVSMLVGHGADLGLLPMCGHTTIRSTRRELALEQIGIEKIATDDRDVLPAPLIDIFRARPEHLDRVIYVIGRRVVRLQRGHLRGASYSLEAVRRLSCGRVDGVAVA